MSENTQFAAAPCPTELEDASGDEPTGEDATGEVGEDVDGGDGPTPKHPSSCAPLWHQASATATQAADFESDTHSGAKHGERWSASVNTQCWAGDPVTGEDGCGDTAECGDSIGDAGDDRAGDEAGDDTPTA